MRKARPPPRPLRPDPTAARAELEARYPSLVRLLWQRTAKYGDGRDASVDEWERACLGVHDHAPVLTVAKATDYAARLWSKYSRRYSPYFSAVPQIVILADTESCGGARAQALHHRVLIDKRHCRPSWLAHELMHLCHVDEQHGPKWRRAMVGLWEAEFSISPERSTAEAVRLGLDVPSIASRGIIGAEV